MKQLSLRNLFRNVGGIGRGGSVKRVVNKEDDDESITDATHSSVSNISVHEICDEEEPMNKRSVQFSSEISHHAVDSRSSMTVEEKQNTWYSLAELNQFKAHTRKLATRIKKQFKDTLYSRLRCSFDGTIVLTEVSTETTDGDASDDDSDDMQVVAAGILTDMMAWTSSTMDGDAFRGIEMYLLRKDQSFFAKEARRVVIVSAKDPAKDVEFIADLYRDLSRYSQMFAATTGNADAEALANQTM